MPKLLASQGESALFTLDAAHANNGMAKGIAGKPSRDYLVTVKTDKAALYRQAKEKIIPVLDEAPHDIMIDRSRGRIKKWSCWITEADDIKSDGIRFPYAAQVACICREVFEISSGKVSK